MTSRKPAFVLGDLLAHEDLRLELVSGGAQAVDRPVAGAHSVELPSPTRFLAPEWVMLSAGQRLRGDPEAQRRLVAELDVADVTALGFGLAPVFCEIPPALLEEARTRSFPVFAVPPETPFRDVVSVVNRCLLSGDLVVYQRLSAMQRYLVDALKEDEPQQTVIERLAGFVGADVLVFHPDGRLDLSTGTASPERLWREIDPEHEMAQEFDVDGWHTVATPIVAAGSARPRWLVVASSHAEFLSKLAKPAAQTTAPLLAAMVRLGEIAQEQERAVRAALLGAAVELGDGRDGDRDAATLAARVASFGLDFAGPARVLLVRPRHGSAGRADLARTRRRLEEALYDLGAPQLVAQASGGVLALVQAPGSKLRELVVAFLDDEPDVVIGIGRSVDAIAATRHSLRDAELAAERVGHEQHERMLDFDDFDLGTLLISEAPPERIGPRVAALLGPLRAHPQLEATVVAYLEQDLDIARTARALNLHPNSLRYRLRHIEKLLGRSLKRPSTIVALYVAILAAPLIDDEPSTAAPRGD